MYESQIPKKATVINDEAIMNRQEFETLLREAKQ